MPAPTTAVLLLLAGSCSLPALAQPAEVADFVHCGKIAPDPERLACFDAQLSRATGSDTAATRLPIEPAAAGGTEPASAAEETVGGAADFGLNHEVVAARPEAERRALPESLTAQVTAVTRQANGALLITLSNDQVWEQTQRSRALRVKVGENVTVKRGALGGFRLFARGKRAHRVKRRR